MTDDVSFEPLKVVGTFYTYSLDGMGINQASPLSAEQRKRKKR